MLSRSRTWVLLATEMKLVRRFYGIARSLLVLILFAGLLYGVGDAGRRQIDLNVLHVTVAMSVGVLGLWCVRPFPGGCRELLSYLLSPVSFEEIMFAKHASLFVAISGVLGVVVGGVSLVSEASLVEFVDAFIYGLTTVLVLLSGGSLLGIYFPAGAAGERGFQFVLVYTIVFAVASLPYLILRVLLGSYLLTLVFIALTAAVWYGVVLPGMSRQFVIRKYEILRRCEEH